MTERRYCGVPRGIYSHRGDGTRAPSPLWGGDMDDTQPPEGLPAIWICPRCGARLVSRNLWHSCGRYSLESLFANADRHTLDLARRYVALLHTLGDVQVIPQKTRLVCVAPVRFSGLEPRKHGFMASFALHRWLDSPASSRRSTMDRDGGHTTSVSDPRPTSTRN